MDDLESLVRLAQAAHIGLARRHDAFRELVVRFQDMAYGYAYALLGDPHLAQDVTQDAFITAYQCLDQLREPRAFPGWLRRLVLTQSTRLLRGKRPPTRPIEEVSQLRSDQPDPAAAAEERELGEQIRAAIQSLPTDQRLVAVLCYIDGYSQREVAVFLEVSVDAVKKRLQRARGRLQERMLAMVRDDLHRHRPSRDDRLVRATSLFTSLTTTAEESQLTTIELMLVDGLDIDARDEAGRTLLHWAAEHGHLDAVELLVDRGANLGVRDASGMTALRAAAARGHEAVAELLRGRGGVE
jgi:RNA polymerase sigma-70 factor (ECF subfamily)